MERPGSSMRRIGLGLACLLAAGMCRAEGLFLAAGETLTILDTADPQTRVNARRAATHG